MTVQPTRDQLRALAEKRIAGQLALGAPVNAGWLNAPTVLALLDQLDDAEKWRDHWHSAWRYRGVKHLAAKKRADEAEARIQAVEDVLAAWHVEPGESGLADDLLRALNT